MKGAIRPQLEKAARNCTPVLLTLVLVFLNVMPVPVPGYIPVTPMLTLISVYYWSIYRPDLFPLAATFGLGIVQDILGGTPVGMTALVLLLVQGIIVNQRRFFLGKTFLVVWWCFMLVAPAAAVTSWVLASLYHWTLIAPEPLFFQNVITILLYPGFSWFFAKTYARFVSKAWDT